jgi:hypothetical protein
MDAYAFALTLGTAGLAAMTVLGFHHGHAPGRSPCGAMARRLRLLRRSWPARDEQEAIERLGYVFEQCYSREPGGAA